MTKEILNILYTLADLSKAYIPAKKKIRVINLLANDICNSKCAMCDIWRQKKDYEFSISELDSILADPLFQSVRAVGITGGEPTLRKDLSDIYDSCCRSLPNLKAMSIITNAIKGDDVIEQITKIKKVLDGHGKKFSVMVSLDGVGEIHDKHRGRDGNFTSAVKVIEHFQKQTDIPVSIGCTITKSNLYGAEELLDWMQEHNVYGRFRVGEFITRLYNDDNEQEIRNFTPDECYYLACFFHRAKSLEPNPKFRRTYDSIISVLLGGQRQIGCPYHENGVVLSSRAELLYCAPKSKVLGNCLDQSAESLYKNNKDELDRIKKDHCADCIHDYHARATKKESQSAWNHLKWQFIHKLQFRRYTYPFIRASSIARSQNKLIFITGWYGTETVGDKAILGGIIHHYRQRYNDKVEFLVSALYPFVTEQTLRELKIKGKVVPYYSKAFVDSAASADITVMGGGPLMEMNALAIPLNAFKIARRHKKQTVIMGCGIGPLYSSYYKKVVGQILKLATEVYLRDDASVYTAKQLAPKVDAVNIGDKAKDYIINKYGDSQKQKKPILACFLRDWDRAYAKNLSDSEFNKTKSDFESNIASAIKSFCREFNLTPHFYCMHTFHVGGDDRIFYRRFLKEHFSDTEYYLEERQSTVDQIVTAMKTSSYNLCMRFHSVLFAHTLNTNYIAIDYTGGGKIKGFLADEGKLDRRIPLEEIAISKNAFISDIVTA